MSRCYLSIGLITSSFPSTGQKANTYSANNIHTPPLYRTSDEAVRKWNTLGIVKQGSFGALFNSPLISVPKSVF